MALETKRIIDPPEGWKYGFPKEVPEDIWQSNKLTEWLVEQGYPKDQIDALGDNFWCRTWLQEKYS